MLMVFWLAWCVQRAEIPRADPPHWSPARALQLELAKAFAGGLAPEIAAPRAALRRSA